MTKDCVAVQPPTSLRDAAGLMWKHDCGALPVLDGPEGAVVGIVTDRDACLSAYRAGKGLGELCVTDAMTDEVVACRPEDDVDTAQRAMSKARIRRLPVVDRDGKLCGILSLAEFARAADGGAGSPSQADVGATLAAICE